MGKIGLIVAREWNEKVRKKSFVVTTLLTPLLMVGMIALVSWLSSRGIGGVKHIEVVDHSGIVAQRLENHPKIVYHIADASPEELKNSREDGKWGLLIIGADVMNDGAEVELYSFGPSTMEVENTIKEDVERVVEDQKLQAYDMVGVRRILDEVHTCINIRAFTLDEYGAESSASSVLSYAVSYVFGFLMYMFVLIYASQVMTGVIEEKSNKVLEVMVSSVRPMELMMGKILGVAAVAVTQFLLWVIIVVGLGGLTINMILPEDIMAATQMGIAPSVGASQNVADLSQALSIISRPDYVAVLLCGFLLYFVGGYLLYAAMFAAVGSAIDNAGDSGQFQSLITMPIVIALVVMFGVMNDPDGSLAVWFSMIPFTSSIVMMARLPYGVPVWEIAVSLALLYGTFVVVLWLAGKVYRVGILMYGKKVTVKELCRWMTYKY
ncbi:MAG: ABC transporter permease [Rikenellaceae bacterium]|jgi:ABC-2 type transport system permease protein|nr:ABC transporter permease [Rikenellaceae bacterium]